MTYSVVEYFGMPPNVTEDVVATGLDLEKAETLRDEGNEILLKNEIPLSESRVGIKAE